MPPTGDEKTVPEITGIASWINSEPMTFDEQRGDVVLVDFWTYTCVNCIRTLPFLKAWHEKYAEHGLVIVGVHTPEFEFEKDRENVIEAVETFAWSGQSRRTTTSRPGALSATDTGPPSISWTRTG